LLTDGIATKWVDQKDDIHLQVERRPVNLEQMKLGKARGNFRNTIKIENQSMMFLCD
jgi:hypothetical protein